MQTREQFENKLKGRKPNATFYPGILDLYKGEFPILFEEYFKEGINIDAIRRFTENNYGINPLLHVAYCGFIDSAMGYHYYASVEANEIDSE